MALILHIGDGKCGSSAIQDALHASRDVLSGAGILYETGPTRRNHFLIGNLIGQSTRSTEPDQEAYAHNMMEAIASRGANAKHVIISSEKFLTTNPDLIFGLFDRYGIDRTDVRGLAYIRAPRSMYASLIQQELKASYKFRQPADYRRHLDRFIKLWRDALGQDRLNVRRFDRATLVGGDVISDFSDYLTRELGALPTALPPMHSNTSLSAEQLIVLQRLRRRLPEASEGKFHQDSEVLIMVFTIMNQSGLIGNPIRLRPEAEQFVLRGNLDTITRMNKLVPGILLDASIDLNEQVQAAGSTDNASDIISVLDKSDATLVDLLSEIVFASSQQVRSRKQLLARFKDDPARQKYIKAALAKLDHKKLGIWNHN